MTPDNKTVTLKIDGMTCVNCESKIERELQGTVGITNAKVSYSSGKAEITFNSTVISIEEIVSTIEKLDYKVVKTQEGIKPKNNNITKILGIVFILLALYVIINYFGGFNIFNVFPQAEEGMGYGMLFVIGLLTSLHCVAMCGGINLSQCVPQAPVKGTGKLSTLRPSILYNFGRVISYTVVGGIVGALGSVVSFSGTAKGIVQLIAGVFMVIMGLNMLNIFPWLRKLNPRMPKIFARKINEQKSSKSPLYVGLLNGLMPCGPLQAMQLYALSTGDPFKGALSMLLFSLGTVPLMFGIGALSSLLSKKFTSKMMTASAVLVTVLGVFMFSSGLSLSGFALPTFDIATSESGAQTVNKASKVDGVQTVTTQLLSGRYEPITVQKGVPVKWIIQAEAGDLNGCNNAIVVPKFNIEKQLEAGDNVIEFTPTESGSFAYSCWMGMIRSKITVVDDLANNNPADSGNTSTYKIPTDKVAVAEIKDGVQTVKIDMDENRFSPAVIVMQSGVETTWIINGIRINSGNSTLLFPVYNAQVNMSVGENTIQLVPEEDFDFSTSDNSFYGYVKVVDDLSKADIEAIKKEVDQYVPTKQEIVDDTGLPNCCQ